MLNRSSARDEVARLTRDLVRIRSVNPPGDELPAAELLAQRLKGFGFETEVVEVAKNRANVVAVLRGRGEGPALMFNGHLDVVPPGDLSTWSRDPFSGDIVDGKIYGRGSSDMKGGVASMSVAGGLLAASGEKINGDLIITAVSGEESDSIGAKHYVERNALDGIGGIVIPESTSLELVIAEKGTIWLQVDTYGKTAHSTQPEIGINAIEHMMVTLHEIKSKWESIVYAKDPYLSPPTINIATISGGMKTNSIPDRCTATIDLRPVPSQAHPQIIRAMEEAVAGLRGRLNGYRGEIKVINERLPFATDPSSDFVKMAQALGPSTLGLPLDPPFGVNFFTDAAIFATKRSIPTIILGPGEYDLRKNIYLGHQPNEYVKIENLEKATRFYYELSRSFLK